MSEVNPRVTTPRLTIAYSVLANGISNLELPPAREDTEILVIVQGTGGATPVRDDVRVIRLDSVGVTKSRNTAIREATGAVLIFGEESVRWKQDGLDDILEIFDDNPRIDVVLGRAEDETGALRKKYPSYREPATVWNSARVGTIELAVRPAELVRKNVFFDEQFGAGTTNYLGDEYILVADANRAKLRCEYFPVTFSSHPRDSSGIGFGTAWDARARSRVFGRVFGWFAVVPRLLLWARNPVRFGRFGFAFVFGLFRD
jgi:hypothetical protein